MNLEALLEDMESLERNIDKDSDIHDVKSDLRDCCEVLRKIIEDKSND